MTIILTLYQVTISGDLSDILQEQQNQHFIRNKKSVIEFYILRVVHNVIWINLLNHQGSKFS